MIGSSQTAAYRSGGQYGGATSGGVVNVGGGAMDIGIGLVNSVQVPVVPKSVSPGAQGQQLRESLEQLSMIRKELRQLAHLEVVEKIGQGSFGDIFKVWDSRRGRWAAMKFEKKDKKNRFSLIKKEASIMQQVRGSRYFAQLFDSRFSEVSQSFSFIEMTFLGPNLENLKKRMSQGRFSLRTVLLIANQMISGLQVLHEKGIVHRDIKPENFVIGSEGAHHQVYVIDFGLSKYYLEEDGTTHILMKQNKGLVGTARYTSVYSHQGYEQSRRDDLESLAYLLLYFARGTLIWQNLQIKDKEERFKKIAELKQITPIETMCRGLPRQFFDFLTLVKALSFTNVPEYDRYRMLFSECYTASYTTPEESSCFDWCPRPCPFQSRGTPIPALTRNLSLKLLGDSNSINTSKNISQKGKANGGITHLVHSASQQLPIVDEMGGGRQLLNRNDGDKKGVVTFDSRMKKQKSDEEFLEEHSQSETLAEQVKVRKIPVFHTEDNYQKHQSQNSARFLAMTADYTSNEILRQLQERSTTGGQRLAEAKAWNTPNHRQQMTTVTTQSFNQGGGNTLSSMMRIDNPSSSMHNNQLLPPLNQAYKIPNRDSSQYVNDQSNEWNSEQDEKVHVQTVFPFNSTNEHQYYSNTQP